MKVSAFATFERDRIATRIREVKQLKKSQGKFTGGKRAFGYDVIDERKVPRHDEQRVIKKMIGLRTKGASYRTIEKWLRDTQNIQLSFVAVREVLLKAASQLHGTSESGNKKPAIATQRGLQVQQEV